MSGSWTLLLCGPRAVRSRADVQGCDTDAVTPWPGLPAYPAQYDHLGERQGSRDRRHVMLWSLTIILLPVAVAFGILPVALERDEGCTLTPPGYFDQTLVSEAHHGLYTTCVLDPNNGEPRYAIHRPWQSLHGL